MGPEPGPSHGPTEALARGSGAALLAANCRREASPRPQVPQRKPERAARGLRRLRMKRSRASGCAATPGGEQGRSRAANSSASRSPRQPLAQSWAVERNVARRWRQHRVEPTVGVASAPPRAPWRRTKAQPWSPVHLSAPVERQSDHHCPSLERAAAEPIRSPVGELVAIQRVRRRVARGPRAVARAPGPQHRAAPRTRRGAAARKARLKDVTAPALRPALDEPLALPPVLLRAWTPGGLLQARPWEPL